jgi:hypothetical protein
MMSFSPAEWMDGWMDDDERVSTNTNKVLFPENRRFWMSTRTGLVPFG